MPQDKVNKLTQAEPEQMSLDDFREKARERYGIPKPLWESLRNQESGGNVDAVSPTGVRGEFQLTQGTARGMGLDRNDPFHQIVGAAKNLREGYDKHSHLKDENERWLAAAGYYYGGPDAVKSDGTLSDKSKDGLSNPQAYVTKIAQRWKAYNDSQGTQAAQRPTQQMQFDLNEPKAPKPTAIQTLNPRQTRPATSRERKLAADETARRNATPVIARMVEDFEALKREGSVDAARSVAQKIKAQYGKWMEVGEGNGWPYVKSRIAGWNPVQPGQPVVTPALEDRLRSEFANKSTIGQLAERGADALARGGGQISRMARQTAGAGFGVARGLNSGDFTPVDLPAWREAEEQRMRVLEERRQVRPSSFATDVAEGVIEAVPAAAGAIGGAMLTGGGLPAAMAIGGGMGAAGADWRNPKRALVQTGIGAVAPVVGGVAGSKIGGEVAKRLASPAAQAAARVGGELLGGGAGNILGSGAEQLAFEGRVDPRELAKQGIIGAALNVPGAVGAARRPSILSAAPEAVPSPAARPVMPPQLDARQATDLSIRRVIDRYTQEVDRINRAPGDPAQKEAALANARQAYMAERQAVRMPQQAAESVTPAPVGATEQQASSVPPVAVTPETPPLPAGVRIIRQGEPQPPREKGQRRIALDVDGETYLVLSPDKINGKRVDENVLRPIVEQYLKPVLPAAQPVTQPVTQGAGTPPPQLPQQQRPAFRPPPRPIGLPPYPRTRGGAIIEDLPTERLPARPQPERVPSAPLVQEMQPQVARRTAEIPRVQPDAIPTQRIQYPDAPPTQEMPAIRQRIAMEEAPTAELPAQPVQRRTAAAPRQAPAIAQEPTNRIGPIEGYEGAELPRRVSRQPEGQPVDTQRRIPAPPRPAGRPQARLQGRMYSEFPADRRGMIQEGRRVAGEIEAGRGEKGEFGKIAQGMFKSASGQRLHGQDSFFHDPAVKGALGLSRDAEMSQVRVELKRDMARMLGVKAEEVSLTQVNPETWNRWARQKGLPAEAVAKMKAAIGRYQEGVLNEIEKAAKAKAEESPERVGELSETKEQEALKNLNAVIADMEARGVLKPEIVSGRGYKRAMKQHEERIGREIKGQRRRGMMPPDIKPETPQEVKTPETETGAKINRNQPTVSGVNKFMNKQTNAATGLQADAPNTEVTAVRALARVIEEVNPRRLPGKIRVGDMESFAALDQARAMREGTPAKLEEWWGQGRVSDDVYNAFAEDWNSRGRSFRMPIKGDYNAANVAKLREAAYGTKGGDETKASTAEAPDIVGQLTKLARTPSSPVEIATLRAEFPEMSKADFDAAMTKLNEEGRIALHRHDQPTEADRAGAVKIKDDYHTAVTLRGQAGAAAEAPKAEHWLNSLSEDQRERTHAIMRDIGDQVESEHRRELKLRPPQGTIGVGGADFDHMLKSQSLESFLRGLRNGLTPDAAFAQAKQDAREIIKNWNERGVRARAGVRSKAEMHRYEGAADTYLADTWRRVLNATKAKEAAPAPKTEPEAPAIPTREQPSVMDRVAEAGKRAAEREKAIESFIEQHGEVGLMAPYDNGRDGRYVIVAPSTKPGKQGQWQATFFDNDGPIRDTTYSDYRKLLSDLGRFEKVNVAQAQTSPHRASVPAEQAKPSVAPTGGKRKYLIAGLEPGQTREVEAEPVKVPGFVKGFEFIAHQQQVGNQNLTIISEATTGLRVAEGNTLEQAISFAATKLRQVGKDEALKHIQSRPKLAQSTAEAPPAKRGRKPRTVTHPDNAINGKEVIAETKDGRVVVANPENESGVSVVKDRSGELAKPMEGAKGKKAPPGKPKRAKTTVNNYLNEPVEIGGEQTTRGRFIEEMKAQGVSQKQIDAYLVGLDRAAPAKPAEAPKGESKGHIMGLGPGVFQHFFERKGTPKANPAKADVEGASLGQAAGKALTRAGNEIRTLWTSADFSAPLSQGALLTIAHPFKGVQSFGKMFRSLSQAQSDAIDAEIAFHPLRRLGEDSGLFLATSGKLKGDATGAEEAYRGTLSKAPVIRHTERAYRTYLDTLRLSTWESYVKALQADGHTFENNPKAYKDAASFINIATGRGQLKRGGRLEKASDILGAVAFAPRNLIANFQVLDPVRYASLAPGARKIVLKDALKAFGAMVGTAAVLKAAGVNVGFNPENDDFMIARNGNTRYDLTFGKRTQVQFLARMTMGAYRQATGEGNLPNKDPLSIAENFAKNKLSPVLSMAYTFGSGYDAKGESVADKSAKQIAWETAAPILWRDFVEAYQEEGKAGVAKTLPAIIGARVNTYPDRAKPAFLNVPDDLRAEQKRAGETRPFLEPRKAQGPNEKDETPAQFEARKAKADEWVQTYGGQLVASPGYKSAEPEIQKAARAYLKQAIAGQSGEQRPSLYLLNPARIMATVRESERRKQRKAARAGM